MKKTIFLGMLLLYTVAAFSQTVYQWRGEGRKGIYNDKNLLKEWLENGPKQVMEIENIGNGYGAPVITDKEIFITGEIEEIGRAHV